MALFAAARPAVAKVLGAMFAKPKTMADGFQLGMRFAPELVFPLINAASMPEGTSAGERLGVGLEALAIGAGTSLGGEFLGGLAGRSLFRDRLRRRGRQAVGGPNAGREMTNYGLQAGGFVGGMAGGFLPMGYTQGVLQKQIEEEEQRQMAMQQLQMGGTLAQLGGLAGLGAIGGQQYFDTRMM